MILGGSLGLVRALFELPRGHWAEAAYTGLPTLGMVVGGVIVGRRPGDPDDPARHRRRVRTAFGLVGCLIVAGVLVAALLHRRAVSRPPLARVAGVSEAGAYRNPYFGFRIRYAPDWQDVTPDYREAAPSFMAEKVDPASFLLALARVGGDTAGGLTVVFMVEALPEAAGVRSGGDYLRQMLPQLEGRREPPRDIQWEPRVMLAGSAFDRVSLRRTWEGREVGMTFWVTVKGGYALGIVGNYATPPERRAIEALLDRLIQFDGP